jgi:hypothetical protein
MQFTSSSNRSRKRKEEKTMKKTANISKERGIRIMRQAILTLGLVALLFTPYLTNTSHAGGNMTGNYQGMAYLAEQEIRTQELQAKAAEEDEVVARASNNTEEPSNKDK